MSSASALELEAKEKHRPLAVVVMGVSSCGKSTIGQGIADSLNIPFCDGDAFHPEANIAKMKSGIPLTDEDRKDWLETISLELSHRVKAGTGVVLACSALKIAYRNILRGLHGEDDHKLVDFVFINGSFELFQERIVARKGHFMPSTLLQSQFDTLQVPTAGETAGTSVKEGKLVVVDASNSIEQIVEQAVEELSK